MSYEDVIRATGRVSAYDITSADNHGGVVAVLKWAKRTGADVIAVRELCETLGLDFAAALTRKRARIDSAATPERAQPIAQGVLTQAACWQYGPRDESAADRLKAAERWLREYLDARAGTATVAEIMEAARAAGIGYQRTRRAGHAVGVISTRQGPAWKWTLPPRTRATTPGSGSQAARLVDSGFLA